MNGWSAKSFSMLMDLLSEAFPDCSLPNNCYTTKQYMKSFGLGYEKIHACPKDCILYRGNFSAQTCCHVCGSSRYKSESDNVQEEELEDKKKKKRKPAKVLRYFPLIPRLQRLFTSSKTASDMRWHHESRKDDGLLRHPADTKLWKSLDEQFPEFSSDPRNVRLGLASDGFNPFKRSLHTTWPVVLIPYNIAPWLGMKQPSFILSMIIPGPKSPGNDIDVFMQPLIEELQSLWIGVDTYDASCGETFKMKAALIGTINDFPAYSMLSGQTTKGRFACPICEESTDSRWLAKGRKFCYMGHRKWLESNHNFRNQKSLFNGSSEHRIAPAPLTGDEVLRKVSSLSFSYGKDSKQKVSSRKRKRDGDATEENECENSDYAKIWKKRSIFFDLPYWPFILLRHNLDLMHIERNVGVNLVSTMLGIKGVTKDNMNARLDLVEMNIRQELHPQILPNGRTHMPPACYTMSKREQSLFFKVIKNLKLPDGYASNISNSVNEKENKLDSLKSHDFHILMQGLLPVALRKSLPKHVVKVIIEICDIFKGVCAKTLDVKELEILEKRAALALCHLEMIFVPSFFTVMVHLVIHVVSEAKIAGPVWYRWMYPIERYLFTLKTYIHNKAQLEGSIAEGYLAEECATFCSRYLEGIETKFTRPLRNEDTLMDCDCCYLFSSGGRAVGKQEIACLDNVTWVQAHRYVLFQHEEVKPFIELFVTEMKAKHRPKRYNKRELDKMKNERFHSWFANHVSKLNDSDISLQVKALALGPSKNITRYKSFIRNGVRFRTKASEANLKSQNSGILVTSSTLSYASSKDKNPVEGDVEYYGILTDIIELDYSGNFKVVLFRGNWADVATGRGVKVDELGYTLVNFKHLLYNGHNISHEPFVISSQVQQVFYVQDPEEEDWHVALKSTTRDAFDMGLVDDQQPITSQQSTRVRTDIHIVDSIFNMGRSKRSIETVLFEGESSNVDVTGIPEQETDLVKRKRGKTMLREVHELPANRRIPVVLNEWDQPIGDNAKLLANWIGVTVRANCPLNYASWHKVPTGTKTNLKNLIKRKFALPAAITVWMKKTMAKRFRDVKSELKASYFCDSDSEDVNLKNCPSDIQPNQWHYLVNYWKSSEAKVVEKRNKKSRSYQVSSHTSGSKSFARVEHELDIDAGKKVGKIKVLEVTHKRKDGTFIDE